MQTMMHLTSMSAGKSHGGSYALRAGGNRRGSGKRGRSLTRAKKPDLQKFVSPSASSFESSGSSRRTEEGRSARSRTVASDTSIMSGDSVPDQTMLTNISSGSDAILRRYESFMNRMDPRGDHNKRPQLRKLPHQLQQGKSSASAKDHAQNDGDKIFKAGRERLSSRRIRHLQPSGKNEGGGGDEGGGGRDRGFRGGVGERVSNRRISGSGCKQGLASPSGSYTRSGEPSSQVAYQATLSPLASASSENSVPTMSNRRNDEGQITRVAVQDANTSNRQRATRRQAATRDSPTRLPTSPPMSRRRHGGTGLSRGRHPKSAAAHWEDNFPDQSEVYDEPGRRFEEPQRTMLSARCEKIRDISPALDKRKQREVQSYHRQSRQQPQEPKSDSIYYGNHSASDVLERTRSLRHLCSLRSRRLDVTGRCQKGTDTRGTLSDEDSDLTELSPRTGRKKRNPQQPQQQKQPQSQRPPMQRQSKAVGRGSQMRGDDHLFDACRSQIYCDRTPQSGCSRHGTWRQPRSANLQLSPPALEDDGDAASEAPPRGIGCGDSQSRRGLTGRQSWLDKQDEQFLIDLIDLIADRFDKLGGKRPRRRSFALHSGQSSDEADVFGPQPSSPDVEFSEGPGTAPWASSRRRQKAAAGADLAGQQRWNKLEDKAVAGDRGTHRVKERNERHKAQGARATESRVAGY